MLQKRFDEKHTVNRGTGCWEWQASITTVGYGQMSVNGRPLKAHRVAYELYRGPIPDGLHIDHLCSNRACVNPDHLEAVTQAENNQRSWDRRGFQEECKNGHKMSGDNVIHNTRQRVCRECKNQWNREYKLRVKLRRSQTLGHGHGEP